MSTNPQPNDPSARNRDTALQASEALLTATLSSIGDGVIATDGQGRVASLNPVAETMTGWTTREAAGRPLEEVFRIFNARTRAQAPNPVERALREGVVVGLANDTLLVARDGTERQIADSCAPIRSPDGALLGAVLVFRDVTDEYAQREALRTSEEKYRVSIEGCPLGILAAGPDPRRFLLVNPAICRMLGYTADELMQLGLADIHPQDAMDRIMADFQALFEGRKTFASAIPCLRKDRSVFYADIHAARTSIGGTDYAIAFFTDVTERRRTESMRELSTEILSLLNAPTDFADAIRRVLEVIRDKMACDAVGLRLQRGEDFPYFQQNGFSSDFLLKENSLVEYEPDGGICRNPDGTPSLECTCGLVISGKTNPANPLFTPGGSCWTNNSFPLLELPAGDDPRNRPRNNCIHAGYASVALVPVRAKGRIVGLLQLNAHAQGVFTLDTVQALEGIASHVGEALLRKQAEESLREKMKALERMNNLMMDREERLLELKAEVNAALEQAGQPPKYRNT